MTRRQKPAAPPKVRCAIYTRKSTEEGLEQEFNTLDAQRETAEALIASQKHEGWVCVAERYDDGGFSGGNLERPAMRRLMSDIEAGRVDCVIVYKVDRLSRSLLDFSRIIECFDKHGVSFVSVTQQFNTANSMGRLMLNVLLSFAQFEREVIAERTRDKMGAARRKGKWVGGRPPLGYDVVDSKLVVNEAEATRVRQIFAAYLEHRSLLETAHDLNSRGWRTKSWTTAKGKVYGGNPFTKNGVHQLLTNVAYAGKVKYQDEVYAGEQAAIVEEQLFERVQELLAGNGRGGAKKQKHAPLLGGLLRCACCDRAMSHTYTARGAKRYRYYVCMRAQQRGWKSCPSGGVPAGQIEEFVVDEIRRIGRDPKVVKETLAQAREQFDEQVGGLRTQEKELLKVLRVDHSELGKWSGATSEKGAAKVADAQDRIRATERRLETVRRDLSALEQTKIDQRDVRAALAEFSGVWDALAPLEQARLVELLVERVEYDGRDGALSIRFRPTGIRALSNNPSGIEETAA